MQPGDVSTPAPPPAVLPLPTASSTPPAPQAGQGPNSPAYNHLGTEVTAAGMDATVGYTVGSGDTLLTVALETGLDLDDVPCAIAPDFQVAQPLVIGDIMC